jgi:hypothetical protein
MANLWNRDPPTIAKGRSFDPNRDRGDAAGLSDPRTGADTLAYLVGPVEVRYDGDPTKTHVIDLSRFVDHQKKIIRSITGEIALDYGIGLCTLDCHQTRKNGA